MRDWLDSLGAAWDRKPPAPEPPDAVVRATTDRYRELFVRLAGVEPETFADYAASSSALTSGGA